MRYRQTEAEPYLLAERARLFLDSDKYDEATLVLEEIAKLDPQQQQEDVIGTRLLALASLAYTRRDYTTATSLYDQAIERFPTLLLEKSSAVFQLAELYFRSRRLAEAKPFYQDFLSRFPGADPEWIAKIRLIQINSFERPQEAFNDMRELSETLSSEEGKQLAALYALTLSTNRLRGASPDSVFKLIGKGTPSPYVLEELWMQQARHALRDDRLQDAFKYSQEVVQRAPNSALLKESSLFFQRLLLLQVDYLLREGLNIELVLLYFKEKDRRFRQPARKGLLHLYVARAMRELKMLDEALNNVIARGGLPGERDPQIEALLNLEFTGILREKIIDRDFGEQDERDSISRFKQAVESLDARFPNRFDNYDYWASRGFYKELQNQLRQAKEIYLYALNGPKIKPKERMALAESIYQVYLKMPDYDKALNAITVLLNIYDEYKDQLNMPAFRVNALWRRVELHIEREAWAELIPAIQDYLEESQSVIPALSGSLDGSAQSRDSAFMQAELEIDRRREALFFQGFAFLKLQDERSAKRIWDLLYKEAPKHVYGKLAEFELFMLSWRNVVSPEVLKLIDP
jgi:tetratricopeptide (TPR) repeat protein